MRLTRGLPLCALPLVLACAGPAFSAAGARETSSGGDSTSGGSTGAAGEPNSGGSSAGDGANRGGSTAAGGPNRGGAANGGSGSGSAGASGSAGSSGGAGRPETTLRAFPGAEGFGTETPGGRGGKVFFVTTLDWSGPGSLAEALFATEPRTIVFRVSGVIEVPANTGSLTAQHAFVTVAGQTSPGGITLRGGIGLASYQANFHDGVFRFMRFRGSGYNNLSFNQTHHFVFDHCDFSGSVGESLDISFSHDFTIQWTTITNSGPGDRMYGMQMAYAPTSQISLHHDFSAHHKDHCGPQMNWGMGDQAAAPEGGAKVDFRNNVIYDCGDDKVFDVAPPASGFLAFNIVGNYAKSGPNTPLGENTALVGIGLPAQVYADDNRYDPAVRIFTSFSNPELVQTPFDFPHVTTHSRAEVEDAVLDAVGAWPRDPMNTRTIAEARAGTGALGNVSDALLESHPTPPPDADRDGIADAWETAHGLDPTLAQDNNADRDRDGYTNLEEYLNDLASQLIGQ